MEDAMRVSPIENELDAQRVQERIHDLAGCHEDSIEEAELLALVESLETWETKRWPHLENSFAPKGDIAEASVQPHEIKPITTLEDYEDATRRIAELASIGAGGEVELAALVAAVQKWDFDHDDASGWKD
ncbi:hypothetical protein [Bosea sp. PAMC 26642]|uniref:hypothetical protein n=1 Tax=Bosea sp. (strain PAMC 26642) TaxID=1792307 RepID=UPI0007704C35|nr:hypothetical protein [Bosea sp. PAMC 26642]AMJ59378.1 hypothetical protein AXW83_02830 [Bosea sp. PAMC 26642]